MRDLSIKLTIFAKSALENLKNKKGDTTLIMWIILIVMTVLLAKKVLPSIMGTVGDQGAATEGYIKSLTDIFK